MIHSSSAETLFLPYAKLCRSEQFFAGITETNPGSARLRFGEKLSLLYLTNEVSLQHGKKVGRDIIERSSLPSSICEGRCFPEIVTVLLPTNRVLPTFYSVHQSCEIKSTLEVGTSHDSEQSSLRVSGSFPTTKI